MNTVIDCQVQNFYTITAGTGLKCFCVIPRFGICLPIPYITITSRDIVIVGNTMIDCQVQNIYTITTVAGL